MDSEKTRQELRAMYVKLFTMCGMPQAEAEQEAGRRLRDAHVSRKTLAKIIQQIGIEKKRQIKRAAYRRKSQPPMRRK